MALPRAPDLHKGSGLHFLGWQTVQDVEAPDHGPIAFHSESARPAVKEASEQEEANRRPSCSVESYVGKTHMTE